ncbi:hypothetical protein [Arthrobacter sp. IK3]|uniref:hypothetical protein n=1 Tax=Arthrobacter sp. IK3 TaxID=3448169 RepID=UPI003EE13D18
MGDHLHKAIGWALPLTADPLDRDSDLSRLTLGDHAGWLRSLAGRTHDERAADDLLYEADSMDTFRHLRLESCVRHVPQLNGGTLLLIPPAYLKDWCRMDDDLDCAFAEDDVESTITYTRSNPYGFSHLWMDAVTGRTLTGPAGDAVTRRGSERANQASLRVKFEGETTPAYASVEEAASRIVPAVPPQVTGLVRHLGSFLAPYSLLQLRPARAIWIG